MNRFTAPILFAGLTVALTACQSHMDMQYSPERYSRLREVQLLTSPPAQPWHLVANVESSGGRFTARDTMINAMIDTARKEGAQALIPLEFERAGKSGLDLFVYSENGRTITKARAIRWGERAQ